MQTPNEAAAENAQGILENIRKLAAEFAGERSERQLRRELVRSDFAAHARPKPRLHCGALWSATVDARGDYSGSRAARSANSRQATSSPCG